MADPDIERIKARHAEKVASLLAANDAERERQRQLDVRASEATAYWVVVWNQLQLLVSAINDDLQDIGLQLTCKFEGSADTPALGRAEIILSGAPEQKRLILNISRLGKVQPVVLVPHSGSKVGDFDLKDASNERLRAEIINFLDQAV